MDRLTAVLGERLEAVQARMAAAAQRVGRSAESVRLVVVTKTHPIETVRAVVAAGAQMLGENYPEEAGPKIAALAGSGAEWHMIGHVQSRKAGIVAANFAAVHSLDSVKLARRLHEARLADSLSKPLNVLIQVNISGEESKFGLPAWNEASWPALVNFAAEVQGFDRLSLNGLMTVPPLMPPESVRPFFGRLRGLRDYLQEKTALDLPELSMGMSADFEVAIEEGATIIRVGTAILGPR